MMIDHAEALRRAREFYQSRPFTSPMLIEGIANLIVQAVRETTRSAPLPDGSELRADLAEAVETLREVCFTPDWNKTTPAFIATMQRAAAVLLKHQTPASAAGDGLAGGRSGGTARPMGEKAPTLLREKETCIDTEQS